MRIEEVASTTKTQRVATHTHIKGLGVKDDGTAIPMAAGFVGQEQARVECGVVVDMIRQKVSLGPAPHATHTDLGKQTLGAWFGCAPSYFHPCMR